MQEYFDTLARVVKEHGFESYLEAPEHEVDTPRHFILTRRVKLGPLTLWGGRRVAEIISEAFGGGVVDDREAPDPVEAALSYEGLRIHILKPGYQEALRRLEEALRRALREPVTED